MPLAKLDIFALKLSEARQIERKRSRSATQPADYEILTDLC